MDSYTQLSLRDLTCECVRPSELIIEMRAPEWSQSVRDRQSSHALYYVGILR